MLKKENLIFARYMLKSKTLLDHLASIGDIVLERELILYILNGLSPKYISFKTTFNVTQFRPSIGSLHSQLESYERILLVTDSLDQESVI